MPFTDQANCHITRDVGEVLIVGATGYSLQKTMRNFDRGTAGCSRFFDWVIFDEASQILMPQAMLSLIHGKGNVIFLGDVCQLPPVIRSSIFKEERAREGDNVPTVAAESRCSLLDIFLRHYPPEFLNDPHRFNVAITRACRKLIVVGSKIFFEAVANSEKQLRANACFKDFFSPARN